MTHSRRNAFLFGALFGAVVAVVGLALTIGRTALDAVTLVDGSPVVEVTSGAMYLLVIVAAVFGGLVIGAIGYGTGVASDADTPRFPLKYLLPVSAIAATVLAYAVVRIGVGGFGDISAGTVEIGALRLIVTVLVMGVVSGGVTAALVDSMARPELFVFEGEALPTDARSVVKAMVSAVGTPIVAAVVAAAFAIPLSIVLIELEGNAAVVLFSLVGAAILGGAALIAAHPWDRPGAQ